MEDRLQNLFKLANKENRTKWAYEWKKQGKKVVGLLDSLVPEEVIYAAGILPWRIQGIRQGEVSQAMVYRPSFGCDFLNHVLRSVLKKELDFLDGIVFSNRDEDFLRFQDYWKYLGNTRLIYLLEVPVIDTELTRQRFVTKVRDFIRIIEDFGEIKINNSMLREAIAVYDKGRFLLKRVYEMRKREVPPLTGSEAMAISVAAMVMPRDEFNAELEDLLPYLEDRKINIEHTQPRVLISSDLLDDPAYINLVEKIGSLVAMDDLDTGSRYFWETVDGNDKDPVYALARRYLKNGSPRMFDWRGQAEQIAEWVREFRVDGVLELADIYDFTRAFRRPYLESWLKEAGIPMMSFVRHYDYGMDNIGQLTTRIGGFLEMLDNKTSS